MTFQVGKQTGFTIVELLIVVVVIAILAAITIISYNGIQNRAKDTAVSAAANQNGKKVLTYAALNSDQYPLESVYRTELAVPADTSSAVYDYYVSDNQKAFCISVTDSTSSPIRAYSFTQNGQLVKGRCVKNLIANPSFETTSGALIPGLATTSRVTVESSSIGVTNGSKSAKLTAIYSASRDTFADLSNWGIQANKTYSALITYTLPDSLVAGGPRFRFNIGGVDLNSPAGSIATGSRPISWTFTATSASASFLRLMPGSLLNEPPTYFDGFMVIEGSNQMQYGDGDSANWSWAGVSHASASFGPSLPL